MKLRVGTRRSPLARAQTGIVRGILEARGIRTEEVLVTSRGDLDRSRPVHQQGEPGAFTRALEDALAAGEIDAAVHSLKDLPLASDVTAILPRGDPRDLLVVRADAHEPGRGPLPLAPGARVGTSAPRRQTQALAADPECVPTDVRGNVETRLKLLTQRVVDALFLANAAVARLPMEWPPDAIRVPLDAATFPTCPGQGALALQARKDHPAHEECRALDDATTRTATTLERAVLGHLGGGCGLPLGCTAKPTEIGWTLDATLAAPDWPRRPRVELTRIAVSGATPDRLVAEAARALTEPPALRPLPPRGRGLLRGKRILFILDADTAAPYLAAARREDAEAAAWTLTTHEPLGDGTPPPGIAHAWKRASWVLAASAKAAPAVAALQALTPGKGPKIGAVGPATARALRIADLPVHLVAPEGTGASLADTVTRITTPQNGPVILPGAAKPAPDLETRLHEAGFETLRWATYETREIQPRPAPPIPLPVDAAIVGSPSGARALAEATAHDPARNVIPLGPTTARALEALGIQAEESPRRRTPEAIVEAIAKARR